VNAVDILGIFRLLPDCIYFVVLNIECIYVKFYFLVIYF